MYVYCTYVPLEVLVHFIVCVCWAPAAEVSRYASLAGDAAGTTRRQSNGVVLRAAVL